MVVLVAIAGRMEVGTLGADGVILVVETEVVVVDCSQIILVVVVVVVHQNEPHRDAQYGASCSFSSREK